MKKLLNKEIVTLIIANLPIGYIFFNWSKLPETIPIHYNLAGEPDGWAGKSSLIIIAFLPLIVYGVLFTVLKFGKLNLGINPGWVRLISITIMTVTTLAMLVLSLHKTTEGMEGINYNFLVIGVIVIAVGQLMKSTEPNSVFGVRTPWTLGNREVWRDTHEFSSKVLLACGLLIILGSLFIPAIKYGFIVVTVIGTLIVTVVYSYFSYQKFEK